MKGRGGGGARKKENPSRTSLRTTASLQTLIDLLASKM